MQNFITWVLGFVIVRMLIKDLIKEVLREHDREENERKLEKSEMKIYKIQQKIEEYEQEIEKIDSTLDNQFCMYTRMYLPKKLELDTDVLFYGNEANIVDYIKFYKCDAFEIAFSKSQKSCAGLDYSDQFGSFKSEISKIILNSIWDCIHNLDNFYELQIKKSILEIHKSFIENTNDIDIHILKYKRLIDNIVIWERRKIFNQKNIYKDISDIINFYKNDRKNCISKKFNEMVEMNYNALSS